jgi:hypothetical protein|mmetsp:Transcript_101785/g.172412  ORF Transcript_101785/g.172412 Transcript_101785/m.172412 type:complete len:120 (-) Transcript_101785:183-542(-)
MEARMISPNNQVACVPLFSLHVQEEGVLCEWFFLFIVPAKMNCTFQAEPCVFNLLSGIFGLCASAGLDSVVQSAHSCAYCTPKAKNDPPLALIRLLQLCFRNRKCENLSHAHTHLGRFA